MTTHIILNAQKYPLSVRLFTPAVGAARGAVLIAPAFGVPQTYYTSFATWLSEQGYVVATFDYSGFAASLAAGDVPLKNIRANMLDWADDAGRVLTMLQTHAPNLPVSWLGHSLGGQLAGLIPNHHLLNKILTIGVGSGYWRENTPSLKRYVWLMWYIFVPLTTPMFGYFPGKRLNMVGDLPRGVIEQWRRWCLHKDYAVGVEGDAVRVKYAAVQTPLTSFSFTDDEFMSLQNTASLHGFYSNAPKTMRRFTPAEIDVKRIGHFGFFKEQFKPTLWREALAELAQA